MKITNRHRPRQTHRGERRRFGTELEQGTVAVPFQNLSLALIVASAEVDRQGGRLITGLTSEHDEVTHADRERVLSVSIPIADRLLTALPRKKADVVQHPEVFDHVGLLVNGPPGTAGLPFI